MDGAPLDKTPEHMANVRLDWQATDRRLCAGLLHRQAILIGFRNGALNTRTREASATFDVGLDFTIDDNLSLRAAVLNITDKIVPVDERGRFDGLDGNWMLDAGRRFWGTVAISF